MFYDGICINFIFHNHEFYFFNAFYFFYAYVAYTDDNSTLSNNAAESSEFFKEPITITNAYLTLISQINKILKDCDLPTLQAALIHQARTPDGVKLNKALEDKIEAAKSSFDLLRLIGKVPSCNWLDTRLIKALAYGSGFKSAINLLESYKSFVCTKKLSDALPIFSTQHQIDAYVTAISAKVKMDPDKITVGNVIQYRWTLENVILDLGNQKLNIKHVRKGCLEVYYHIPIHCSFNAYKMSLHNCHNFYTINLIHIEIGNHPLIYDPWLSDLESRTGKQIFHTQYEGKFVLLLY